MEYIRVKITDGQYTSSQLMTENQFKEWLKGNNIWNRAMLDGISISFSKCKKSALLTNKN